MSKIRGVSLYELHKSGFLYQLPYLASRWAHVNKNHPFNGIGNLVFSNAFARGAIYMGLAALIPSHLFYDYSKSLSPWPGVVFGGALIGLGFLILCMSYFFSSIQRNFTRDVNRLDVFLKKHFHKDGINELPRAFAEEEIVGFFKDKVGCLVRVLVEHEVVEGEFSDQAIVARKNLHEFIDVAKIFSVDVGRLGPYFDAARSSQMEANKEIRGVLEGMLTSLAGDDVNESLQGNVCPNCGNVGSRTGNVYKCPNCGESFGAN